MLFRHMGARTWEVAVPVALLVLLIPIVNASSPLSNVATSNCAHANLERQMLDEGFPVSQRTARNFAESSALYASLIKGNSSSFTGTGNEWNLNFADCTVSWSGVLVNYLLISAATGSKYILTFDENPTNAIISSYEVSPWFSATIATNASETYSGYGVAVASHPVGTEADEVNYTGTYWFQPTVSNDASPGCGSGSSICELAVWTGIQNSTYDGPDHSPAHGEVIQTGTIATVTCSGSCSETYNVFSEYTSGDQNGIYQEISSTCPGMNLSTGDDIVASVGSQAVINGTSGKAFYTFLEDDTSAKACNYPYNTSLSGVCLTRGTSPEACKIAGHEYYADYFAERPACGSSCGYFQLPDFTSFYFYECEMLNSSTGSYPYYNDGYGIGSVMSNNGTVNTSTGSMSETGGSVHYGYFQESWVSSVNT